MHRHFKHAALAAAVLATFNVHAADESELTQVIVTATRDSGAKPNPAQDASVVDRTTIEHASSSTIAEVLANQAGIEIATNGGPTTTTGVFIRGTKPAQSVVLIDGFRLTNPTDGTAPIEGLPLSMMERLEVIRGGASGNYGSGAIGGVVQLFTRNPDHAPSVDAAVTVGRYGTYRSEAGYGGKLGDTSFYLGLGTDGAEGFSATNSSSANYSPDKDSYHRQSVVANLRHDFGNGQSVRLNALSIDSHTAYDSAFAAQPSVDGQIQLLGLTFESKITQSWRAEFKVGETSYDYKFKNAGFTFAPKTDSQQFSWLNHLTLPFGKLTLGLEREQQKVSGAGVSYLQTERTINSTFAQWQETYGRHDIQAAVRSDQWTNYGAQTTGNLLYAYGVAPNWSLTGSLAKAFRAPTFDDLYFPFFGSNPLLKPETSRSVELGTRYRKGGDEFRVLAFRNRIENAIELDATFTPQNVEALIKGWTTSWNHIDENWRWSGSFTHQNPRDLGSGDQLSRRAHNLVTASLERELGVWRLGGELRSQDERYTQSPNSSNFRMAGYGLLNAYASYAISPSLSAQVRIDNLTDKRYELVQGYNTAQDVVRLLEAPALQ